LIHVDGRAPAQRVSLGNESKVGRPQLRILYLDRFVLLKWRRKLQVQIISETQIPAFERRIKHSSFEANIFYSDCFATSSHGKFVRRWQLNLSIALGKIPLLWSIRALFNSCDKS